MCTYVRLFLFQLYITIVVFIGLLLTRTLYQANSTVLYPL